MQAKRVVDQNELIDYRTVHTTFVAMSRDLAARAETFGVELGPLSLDSNIAKENSHLRDSVIREEPLLETAGLERQISQLVRSGNRLAFLAILASVRRNEPGLSRNAA